MRTKLDNLIENCIKNGGAFNGCDGCQCDERECLISLLSEHNENCSEDEVISCEDFS